MRSSLPLGVLLATALPCAAQTPVELVGLVDRTPAPVVRQDMQTCATAQCPTLMTSVARPFLGGTAYDATISAVWISNGPLIQAVNVNNCNIVCPPQALPGLGINVGITGLAMNEAQGVLVVTDTNNAITQYRATCPLLLPVASCTPILPLGHQIAGVATDDVNDLVIYSASNFAAPVPGNLVFVAKRSNPCVPLCSFPVNTCGGVPMGPLTGVAYDPCRRVVWTTDGKLVVGNQLSNLAPCAVQEVKCCTMGVANGYVGLCIKPSEPTSTGGSCTNFGCPACPGLRHTIAGDPAIGNPAFSLDLQNAPGNSIAALFFGLGPCNAAGPVVFPLCGPILVPLAPPPVVFNFPTGGAAGSCVNVNVPLPIPADPTLCGATLSTQWIGVCATALIGTYVSNCQSWTITGS